MKNRRKGVGRIWEYVLFWIAGMGCVIAVIYPLLSNYMYNRRQGQIIVEHEERLEGIENSLLEQERAACQEYNQQMIRNSVVVMDNQAVGSPGLSTERFDSEMYEARLNLSGDGVMGYVMIPKINVNLPIRHYANAEVLESGVGHLPESSLPIGGTGSHAVLTGHTGNADKVIFTDLNQLEKEDCFFIKVLGEVLVYKIDQILVVLPHQVDALQIDEKEDYVTLITCTPYGINSHRLLVRGCRVETEDTVQTEKENGEKTDKGTADTIIEMEKVKQSYSTFGLQYLRSLILAWVLGMAVLAVYYIERKVISRRKREIRKK